MSSRPPLADGLSEDEFVRWYWTMAELQPFAREIGVRAAGPKAALMRRIAAQLGGRPQPVEQNVPRSSVQLTGHLTHSSEIPPGQRSSEDLRRFFAAEIGPNFTFNGHMRSFLKAGGATLGDAIDHWHRTLGTPLPKQSDSLEFNRFTRLWHEENPDGTSADCQRAWAAHRALPIDER